jgi:hypothetical protein
MAMENSDAAWLAGAAGARIVSFAINAPDAPPFAGTFLPYRCKHQTSRFSSAIFRVRVLRP